MPKYKHLYSPIAHFMRYNRKKWKPLIGRNGLAQYHRVLRSINILRIVWHMSYSNDIKTVDRKFLSLLDFTGGETTMLHNKTIYMT